jgi:WhiB family transcriptional regulator, redox-sensing transcriptional regulator
MARHPRAWEPEAACFNHDEEPEVIDLLASLSAKAAPYGVSAPMSVSELFYPPRVRELYHVYADEAKAYCFGPDGRHPCPVRKECLLWAIEADEEHGIWGGQSHRERNALKRKAEKAKTPIAEYIEANDC